MLSMLCRPSSPPHLGEWIVAFGAPAEDYLRHRVEILHIFKKGFVETGKSDIETLELQLKNRIHILAEFRRVRRVCEAARVLTLRYRSGRRGGVGDGIIDTIPDEGIVWFVGEG